MAGEEQVPSYSKQNQIKDRDQEMIQQMLGGLIVSRWVILSLQNDDQTFSRARLWVMVIITAVASLSYWAFFKTKSKRM